MGEYIPGSRKQTMFWLRREPIGVCALIIPWNAPLAMLVTKMSQALATGNTCVIKPPSIDSLTSLEFAKVLENCNLPEGAVNIITGPGGTVGEALASHPDVGMVSFTGSCETGQRIMELASKTVKRLSLEWAARTLHRPPGCRPGQGRRPRRHVHPDELGMVCASPAAITFTSRA
jgi:acyl-CoA reductase-like NAD-dependent aldehyde dehydrogenase